MDSGLMAPPCPSDIDSALKILCSGNLTPYRSDVDDLIWAISIVVRTMNLIKVDIEDINKNFSINGLAEIMSKTLEMERIMISKDTIKVFIIIALNEFIKEVNEHPEDRLYPEKTAYFALGERLVYNGITKITKDDAGKIILDTASFIILSIAIQQAISESINESITSAVIDNVPKDLQNALSPKGIPINLDSLSYFVKHELLNINNELYTEKQKKYNAVVNILSSPYNQALRDPQVFNNITKQIRHLSVNVVSSVEKETNYAGFKSDLTLSYSDNQGLLSFGWSG
jgi:hypothetical protein